ncbi:MAG: hypothetical protein WBP38_12690 [Hyphomicrobium sp.]|nr:hypothetical protein [Hyphomicrobium sp.]
MKTAPIIVLLGCAFLAGPASAAGLTIELTQDAANPAMPEAGDRIVLRSTIENRDLAQHHSLTAWISLVQIGKDHDRLIDPNGWVAKRTALVTELQPGAKLNTDWTIHLLQSGAYKAAVSVADRMTPAPASSRFVNFSVKPNSVVDWRRVLPVAFGVPSVIAALIGLAWLRRLRWTRS